MLEIPNAGLESTTLRSNYRFQFITFISSQTFYFPAFLWKSPSLQCLRTFIYEFAFTFVHLVSLSCHTATPTKFFDLCTRPYVQHLSGGLGCVRIRKPHLGTFSARRPWPLWGLVPSARTRNSLGTAQNS